MVPVTFTWSSYSRSRRTRVVVALHGLYMVGDPLYVRSSITKGWSDERQDCVATLGSLGTNSGSKIGSLSHVTSTSDSSSRQYCVKMGG